MSFALSDSGLSQELPSDHHDFADTPWFIQSQTATFPNNSPHSRQNASSTRTVVPDSPPDRRPAASAPPLLDDQASGPSLSADDSYYSDASDLEVCPGTRNSFVPVRPLHELAFNINGYLPIEAPFPLPMDDSETGPLTQPFLDPRRQGTKPMLKEQDETDVLCILMPTSRPAHDTVELVAKVTPQHILQNHFLPESPEVDAGLYYDIIGATRTDEDDGDEDDGVDRATQPDTQVLEAPRTPHPSRDIALRMSSKIHNPSHGFVFGRNPSRCDLVCQSESSDRLSNCHFRIFLNRHAVLMLEDTSTNGTYVDKSLLRCRGKPHDQPCPSSRTLTPGSIIELPTQTKRGEDTIRFIVKFPSRDLHLDQYNQNLSQYLVYIQQAERRMDVAAAKGGRMPPPALLPFNAMKVKAETEPSPEASMLGAATNDYHHGVGWNGGDKYNVVNQIGKGAFALVYKLSAKENGEVYACKQIEKRRFIKDGVLNHKVHNEILVMKDLEHPNIVKYIEYHETKVHIFIVMEFVGMGDLSVYTNAGQPAHEYMCKIMTEQMIHALEYLHERKITHRDIKPDNILLASSSPFLFKLSDFGLSKIMTDETFLKSFCGTLLYCAPEIYPGYQRVKLGLHPSKRTRSWEPKKGTQRYEHSVDIWSISAVLFHLLCGHAPYNGSMDDEGASMLMSIFRVTPNWDRLEQAGISMAGIDFVKRTLVIEPSERAQEAELLKHPWLTGNNADFEEGAHANAANDLDASQLSLTEKVLSQDFEPTDDDYEDPRKLKRSKIFQPIDEEDPIDLFGVGNPRQQGYSDSPHQWSGAQPAFQNSQPQHVRLFGEIGSSALRSSGVLGANAYNALEVLADGSFDPSSDDNSYMYPESTSAEAVSFLNPRSDNAEFDPNSASTEQHNLQYPQLVPRSPSADPAPSLLGTEALVGQMNMASPDSRTSGPSIDSNPMTPKTPRSRELSPARVGHTASHHVSKSPRAMRMNAREDRRAGAADNDPATTPAAPATSAVLEFALLAEGLTEQKPEVTAKSQGSGTASEGRSQDDGQQPCAGRDDVSFFRTTLDSQGSLQDEYTTPGQNAASDGHDLQEVRPAAPPAINHPPEAKEKEDSFAKPPLCFGKLTPTAGSVASQTIRVTSRKTTFGREAPKDFLHPNIKDNRIPKHALDILMHYPGIEEDINNGKKNWHKDERLTAVVSTRTHRYIKINGIRMMKGERCWAYTKLKTGDTVSIFEPSEGADMSKANAKTREYLHFHCEFFVGASKEPRKQDEPVVIQEEKRKYEEDLARGEARRSRQASTAPPEDVDQATSGCTANVADTRSRLGVQDDAMGGVK